MSEATFRFRSRYSPEIYFEVNHVESIDYYDQHGGFILHEDIDKSYTDFYTRSTQYCDDTVGFRHEDNPLWLSSETSGKARAHLDGVEDTTGEDEYGYSIRTVNLDWSTARFSHLIHPEEFLDDDIEFVTQAASASNPSNAKVSTAVFLAELRDLPGLFETVGSNLSKFGANEYLKFQYGWKPFIKDLRKLWDTVEYIQKRLGVIQRLQQEGFLRLNYDPPGSVGFKHYDLSEIDHVFNHYYFGGGRIGLSRNTVMTTRRWCQTLWKPEPPEALKVLTTDSRFEAARNAVYGLNIDGPTLWQAMPWSWLIDWVHNTSDFIESQNNTVGAKYHRSVLMRHSRITTVATPLLFQNDNFTVGNFTPAPGVLSSEVKERILDIEPGVVTTGNVTEILSDTFKMSILGALGIQRLRR